MRELCGSFLINSTIIVSFRSLLDVISYRNFLKLCSFKNTLTDLLTYLAH